LEWDPEVRRRWNDLWSALQRSDLVLLLSLLGIASCIWMFVIVANQVAGRSALDADQKILLALRQAGNPTKALGPSWLQGGMRDITALGSPVVLVIVVLASAVWLWVRRQHHAFALLLASTLGARFLNAFLKGLFARPRPDIELHLMPASSPSFPSGHAMDSAAIYLTIAALIAQQVQSRVQRLYLVGLAASLSLVIGVSRVYLGVHYPSDVLAGWCAGLAWALMCWTVARRLQQKGALEPPK
jgi:undecaprenyl-diphosphatase